jgi:hypothetical protein
VCVDTHGNERERDDTKDPYRNLSVSNSAVVPSDSAIHHRLTMQSLPLMKYAIVEA